MDTFDISVNGIPALAVVTDYICVAPQGKGADSDLDCHGYSEIEYTIKDRKGYPKVGDAAWLLKIVNDRDLWQDIHEQILWDMENID